MGHYGNELAEQAKLDFATIIGKNTKNGRTIVPRSEAALGIGLALDGDGPNVDARGYRAIAEVLLYYSHYGAAEATCTKSPPIGEESEEALGQSNARELLLARICLAREAFEQALEHVEKATIGTNPSPAVLRAAYLTKARILRACNNVEAVKWYSMARTAGPPGTTPGDILDEEVGGDFNREEASQAVVEILKSFTDLDRLTWMTWEWWSQGDDKHNRLQHIAARSDQDCKRVVLEWYKETLRYLDHVHAGAPLRYHLAKFHLQIFQDYNAARDVLDEILDSKLTDGRGSYKFTAEDPSRTLRKAILLQTDVMFQQFCGSTDPTFKEELFKDMQELRERPLALEASLFSSTAFLKQRLIIARVVRKVKPASEFQRLLKDIVTDARVSLTDDVIWNDSTALAALGTALALLAEAVPSMRSELWKAAQIMVSARLEAELDGTEVGDATKISYGSASERPDDLQTGSHNGEPREDDLERSDDLETGLHNGEPQEDDNASSGLERSGDLETGSHNGEPQEDDDASRGFERTDNLETGSSFGSLDYMLRRPPRDPSRYGYAESDSDIADDDDLDDLLGHGDENKTRDVEDDEADFEAKKYQCQGSGTGQIQYGGVCVPRTVFTRWDESQGQVGYQCTTCSDTVLCQTCYNKLQASSRGEEALPRHFCGSHHDFLRAPVEGWGGIWAGVLKIQGESAIEFKKYMAEEIDALMQRAWEDFWRGG